MNNIYKTVGIRRHSTLLFKRSSFATTARTNIFRSSRVSKSFPGNAVYSQNSHGSFMLPVSKNDLFHFTNLHRSISGASFIPKVIGKVVKLPVYLGGGLAAFGSYVAYKVEETSQYTQDKLGGLKDFVDGIGGWFSKEEGEDSTGNNKKRNNNNNNSGATEGIAGASLLASLDDADADGIRRNRQGEEERGKANDDEDDEEKEEAEEEEEDEVSSKDTTGDDMVNLTKQMIEIRNILNRLGSSNANLTLPSIVVIGSQSSGKSSVLESIVGKEFLPKGSNMVTRRPIELTLVNTLDDEITADFPQVRKYNIKNFNEVKTLLTDMNLQVSSSECISEDPIQITIKSNKVPDLSMVDLPGYIQIESVDQPIELKNKIKTVCNKYLQAPNIILAISPADVDLANSSALKASRAIDPKGERTIGVITKLDLVPPEYANQLLNNKKYPLKMGYVGVINKLNKKNTIGSQSKSRNFKNSIFGTSPDNQAGKSATSQTGTNASALSPVNEQFEITYFKENNKYFQNCEVTSKKLRHKLIKILEVSMSNALEPTSTMIEQELDEASYRFKVEFNDRQLTPKSYLLTQIDVLKLAIKELQANFTRNELKSILKADLDQKVLDILSTRYWKESNNTMVYEDKRHSKNTGGSGSNDDDDVYWHKKLELASSSLTKIGVGRLSTQLVTNSILTELNNIIRYINPNYEKGFINELVNDTAINVLNSKFFATADQVENCIKPFKYEIDIEDRDWKDSREHSIKLLKEELKQCNERLLTIKNGVGNGKLQQVVSYLNKVKGQSQNRSQFESTGSFQPQETLGFSKLMIERGLEYIDLNNRSQLLNFRVKFMRSSKCGSTKDMDRCPEIYLNAINDKLTSTAVLFLNVELLSDFFYNFPIDLDRKISTMSPDQMELFAKEDPKIARHIELQNRKELLELALSKIDSILVFRKTYKGYMHK